MDKVPQFRAGDRVRVMNTVSAVQAGIANARGSVVDEEVRHGTVGVRLDEWDVVQAVSAAELMLLPKSSDAP